MTRSSKVLITANLTFNPAVVSYPIAIYLFIFEAKVAWGERSARGVMGRGQGTLARSKPLSLRKQINSDLVQKPRHNYAFVTAFLQTGLFLDSFILRKCEFVAQKC